VLYTKASCICGAELVADGTPPVEAGMDASQLRKIPLFSNLTTDHLGKVAAIGVERAFEAGQVVFREGEVGTDFFVILTGKVRISKMVPGVGEEALAILEPGS
jgi:CRP/FNR family transcriptional regulator, cyclic AMP receptor protein